MPPDLAKAHAQLDQAVDRLYRPSAFVDDAERAEHLIKLYETLAQPLTALAQEKSARKPRQSPKSRKEQ